jgi:putative hemolysin
MEFIIVLLLIILNGLFAMSEIAIVSIRKSKLQKEANEGNKKAKVALELANNPSRFLSTVQIGITFIGVFIGAFGGESFAQMLAKKLQVIPFIAPYSQPLSLFLVVALITYVSLIIGELVPKRIALTRTEKVAKNIAGPMTILATITSPLVSFLTFSGDVVIRFLRIKPSEVSSISEEEVTMLINEGTATGVFTRSEKDIVERTFQLDEKNITSFMTPRKDIVWLDVNNSFKSLSTKIIKYPHSHFPVCRDSLDNVLGIVRTEELFTSFLTKENLNLTKSLYKPIYVPETMKAWKVMELFKKSGIHIAFVVDEYGSILGLLSLGNILEEIVGDIPSMNELDEKDITKKDDGSFLINGLIPISEFKSYFKITKLPGERSGTFHTIGGFVMDRLGRIPALDDHFDIEELRFQVIEMDGNRVNKILITTLNAT